MYDSLGLLSNGDLKFSQNTLCRLTFVINEQVSALRHDRILEEVRVINCVMCCLICHVLMTASDDKEYCFSCTQAKAVHMTVVGTLWNRILSTMSQRRFYTGGTPIPRLDVLDPKFSLLTAYRKVLIYLYFGFHGQKCNLQYDTSHSQGSEEITLDAVRRHCLKRPNDIILYMHSKGMYHPWPRNEKFRQNAMKGIPFVVYMWRV